MKWQNVGRQREDPPLNGYYLLLSCFQAFIIEDNVEKIAYNQYATDGLLMHKARMDRHELSWGRLV